MECGLFCGRSAKRESGKDANVTIGEEGVKGEGDWGPERQEDAGISPPGLSRLGRSAGNVSIPFAAAPPGFHRTLSRGCSSQAPTIQTDRNHSPRPDGQAGAAWLCQPPCHGVPVKRTGLPDTARVALARWIS